MESALESNSMSSGGASSVPSSSSSSSISSRPELVLRIGVREAAVAVAVGGLFVGAWHVREWNQRRRLAREEHRKARAKEWAKMRQRATDAAFYTAVLAGIGAVSWPYFAAQKVWQQSSDATPPEMQNRRDPLL